MNLKVLVTGAGGKLGWDVVRELEDREIDRRGVDITDFDITDARSTSNYIVEYAPDVLVHCSAYTAVDAAEGDPERCIAVNAEGTRSIAVSCREIGAKLLYISTDYVFSGAGYRPYEVNDLTDPASVYGKSKLMGEQYIRNILPSHYIIRTSWAFGANGQNFIEKILLQAKLQNVIPVVEDQIGSPTYTVDLAGLVCDILKTDCYGTYHATNEGFCSRAELADEALRLVKSPSKIRRVLSSEFPAEAIRPKNSRLSKRSLDEAGFRRLPDWRDALKRYLNIV